MPWYFITKTLDDMAVIAGFQVSGFNVLTMTYLNSRSALVNGNITNLTWIDLNSIYLQSKYIADC